MTEPLDETDTSRMLERLAETFPDQPAPLPDLMKAAHADKRRRTRTTLASVAASVVLVLGGGVVAQQVISGDDSNPKPDQVAEPLPAPEGMRYVAMKRVAVAVPASWGMQDNRCGQPVAATVYFTEGATRSCLVTPEEAIPTLHFVDAESDEGRLDYDSLQARTLNGLSVFEGEARCPSTASCIGPMPYVIDIQTEGVQILLEGPAADDPLRSQIVGTLRLLPDDLVAVPWIDAGIRISGAAKRLGAVGLDARIEGDGVDVRTFGTDPPAGSVVKVGSEIALVTTPGGGKLSDEHAAIANRIVQGYIDDNPDWDVDQAWARWEQGTVDQANVGECLSGELLRISMFGTFPIPTSGFAPVPGSSPSADPDPLADVVTEVFLTADASTEEVCLLSVAKGTRSPDPRDTLVYRVGSDVDPSAEPTVLPSGARLVDDLDDVLGAWRVNDGGLGMSISRNGKRYVQSFPVDCNSGSQLFRLDGDGDVRVGATMTTTAGCGDSSDYRQAHPVVGGQRLFLTPEGRMLAVNPSGLVAATYVRADRD
ncbi:hypothetical protein [Nocardioides sp.]|uniref:hypothetical protein n=1 Tax=Nocardioides sp. TaxID=35761 RepID=UPI003569D09E